MMRSGSVDQSARAMAARRRRLAGNIVRITLGKLRLNFPLAASPQAPFAQNSPAHLADSSRTSLPICIIRTVRMTCPAACFSAACLSAASHPAAAFCSSAVQLSARCRLACKDQRFRDDFRNRHMRIESCRGILKDHLYAHAFPYDHFTAVRRADPHDTACQRGLANAGRPDQPLQFLRDESQG